MSYASCNYGTISPGYVRKCRSIYGNQEGKENVNIEFSLENWKDVCIYVL